MSGADVRSADDWASSVSLAHSMLFLSCRHDWRHYSRHCHLAANPGHGLPLEAGAAFKHLKHSCSASALSTESYGRLHACCTQNLRATGVLPILEANTLGRCFGLADAQCVLQLYDPGRIPASPIGLVQLADEAKTTIESYADVLLPKLPKGLDSVEAGSGAVLQVPLIASCVACICLPCLL